MPGILGLDKCFVRKMGFSFYVDLHIVVDGELTVREGHLLSHQVEDEILGAIAAGSRGSCSRGTRRGIDDQDRPEAYGAVACGELRGALLTLDWWNSRCTKVHKCLAVICLAL